MDELAHLLSSEHGKVIADSKGDIQRGLEVIEFCCGIPHVLKGEYTQGAGPGDRRLFDAPAARHRRGHHAVQLPGDDPAVDVRRRDRDRQRLHPEAQRARSVGAGAAGRAVAARRGCPRASCRSCTATRRWSTRSSIIPAISAVSFVGSSDIAHYVYRRGVAAGKRVQAMGGAKNHGIVMPDADLDQVVADLSGAAFGSAGERCMALPVVVPVGDKTADALREKLIPAIEALRVGVIDRCRGALRPGRERRAQAAGRELDPDRRRRGRRAGRRRPRLPAAGA